MSGKYKSDCYAVQLHFKSMTYLTLYDIAHAMALLHELSLLETVNAALRAQLERCYKGTIIMEVLVPKKKLITVERLIL